MEEGGGGGLGAAIRRCRGADGNKRVTFRTERYDQDAAAAHSLQPCHPSAADTTLTRTRRSGAGTCVRVDRGSQGHPSPRRQPSPPRRL